MAESAKLLVVVLATSGGGVLEEIAKQAGVMSTRIELVEVYARVVHAPLTPGRRLGDVAGLLHRPGRAFVSCSVGLCRVPVGRRGALPRSHQLRRRALRTARAKANGEVDATTIAR